MTKMTKYQLNHFENKVNRYFQPLIDEQQLLIKQYRTEATNNVVKKLAKKMGADKILAKMKEAEDRVRPAQVPGDRLLRGLVVFAEAARFALAATVQLLQPAVQALALVRQTLNRQPPKKRRLRRI